MKNVSVLNFFFFEYVNSVELLDAFNEMHEEEEKTSF